MGRAARKHFSREFKLAALSRVQDGVRSMATVAREVGVNPGTLRAWKRQLGGASVGPSAGASSGAPEGLRGEVVRLRREVAALRQERDILKKAAAFFARDVS
jgi:transposase